MVEVMKEKAVCCVGRFDEILTTTRLLRYSSAPSALHPIFFFHHFLSQKMRVLQWDENYDN